MNNSKFLLFHGIKYEEMGGWGDFEGSFETLEECLQWVEDHHKHPDSQWIEIVKDEKVIIYGYGDRAKWEWHENRLRLPIL